MENKKNNFLKEFFKERKTVGAIRPSSRSLAKKMLKNVDFKNSDVIVEYGPGTGVFTRKIIDEMNPNATLYVFELHKPFYEKLKKEFDQHKQVKIINDSAENVRKYIEEDNNKYADVIISSLPLTNFDQKLTMRILKSAEIALKPQGYFIQFQYSLNARKLLLKIFTSTSIQFTINNLPPAFVYTCKKK
ncbi:class I SAM-dependent methyltransferase [Brumimicrobium aurantiacum]|uniref:Methyltransferase domain-containing protein n=1 Tax=Brumimicrobium aurantiacum TaxID=1737063 RepID=A0A3E1F021_9FLAO|nr:rRNA adenine N-6-methyltransferase family protein [Brumimicrobium aurantiacum]RFC55148.1 methyltransferase domain-containing protein [Brumimicrobium aurantiacum]